MSNACEYLGKLIISFLLVNPWSVKYLDFITEQTALCRMMITKVFSSILSYNKGTYYLQNVYN